MKRVILILVFCSLSACRQEKAADPDVQDIVDRAIETAGGDRYRTSRIRFMFRDREYITYRREGQRIMQRITTTDSSRIEDIRRGEDLVRLIDSIPQELPDSTARKYSNSVNSVHYFAYLPYGLNSPAVNKRYLGRTSLGSSNYHKVQITFEQEGGGADYEDVFVYWFNVDTYLPDYLAYEYHTDEGGKRFRKAYNERKVGGIRFVDYINYEYEGPLPVSSLDSLYKDGLLKELSRVALSEIQVTPGNYN